MDKPNGHKYVLVECSCGFKFPVKVTGHKDGEEIKFLAKCPNCGNNVNLGDGGK